MTESEFDVEAMRKDAAAAPEYMGGVLACCDEIERLRLALYCRDDTDAQNAGCNIAASKLRQIAETGVHIGVFGCEVMEAAAQAILFLCARLAEAEARLAKRMDFDSSQSERVHFFENGLAGCQAKLAEVEKDLALERKINRAGWDAIHNKFDGENIKLANRAEAAEARVKALTEALEALLDPQGHPRMAMTQARAALQGGRAEGAAGGEGEVT